MPEQVITPPPVKSGLKSSEFYLAALVHALGWLMTTGVVADGSLWARLIGGALALLSAMGYGAMRTAVKNGAAIMLACLLLHSTACGASGDKALADTLAGAETAQIAFVTYDGIHQHSIITKATSEESGAKQLAEWRGTQLTIEQRFTELFHSIAAAAVLKQDPSASGVVKALSILQNDLRQLGVPL